MFWIDLYLKICVNNNLKFIFMNSYAIIKNFRTYNMKFNSTKIKIHNNKKMKLNETKIKN